MTLARTQSFASSRERERRCRYARILRAFSCILPLDTRASMCECARKAALSIHSCQYLPWGTRARATVLINCSAAIFCARNALHGRRPAGLTMAAAAAASHSALVSICFVRICVLQGRMRVLVRVAGALSGLTRTHARTHARESARFRPRRFVPNSKIATQSRGQRAARAQTSS